MGRPELSKEEKRSERITLKLTKEEKKKLDKAAAICGLPPVVLVREKLFKGKFPVARIPKVDLDTYVELKKIGVNINQQTKQLNAGKLPIGLLALLNKLKAQEEKIIRGLFMIASQKIGKSFVGALNYNIKKLYHPDLKKRAELLESSFVSTDSRMIQQELRLIRSLKPNLNRYVYHTSLNFSIEDQLDNNKLLLIAHDYLKESGYTNNQYMIFRHHDAPHPHIHLLVNRISFDGTVVSDSNNFKRSEDIIRKLERKYNLKAVQPSKQTALKAVKIGEIEKSLRTGKPSDKLLLQNKLINIIDQGSLSIEELIKRGERQGIHFLFNQATTGKISGITYFHNGFKIKGQALGNRFKWAELTKQINYEQIRDGKAISEANSRTRTNYGDQSWSSREVKPNQYGGSRGDELYTSGPADPYFDEGNSRGADKIGEESGSKPQRDFKAGEDVYILHDDSPIDRDNSHYDSYGFEISDDVDDEAIYGKSRNRKSQGRGMSR